MTVPEQRKLSMARYLDANRAQVYFQNAGWRDDLRMEMVEAYGGKCQHCGESDPIVMTLDHINDDPEPEIEAAGKSSRGGYVLYRKLKKQGWPQARFQLLCFNCNMKKEHKRRRDGMFARLGIPPEQTKLLTRGEARAKAGPSYNNKSGFKGVIWLPQRERWQAQIRADGKFIYIGKFPDIRDAAKAYRAKAIELWKELYKPLTDEEIEEIAKTATIGTVQRPGRYLVMESEKSAEELGL